MSATTPKPMRPYTELLLLGVLMAATTLVFWTTDLDIRVAALFYDPSDSVDPWPGEHHPLWGFFYYAAPIVTTLLALGGFLALALGLLRSRYRHLRRPAAFVLLTLVVGPGLVVNALLKDNWGRPRPRQVEQFGGDLRHIPPLAVGETREGKSFASGHASVGFTLFTLWFLWRRRRPGLAWATLLGATALGTLMGLGRMAAGAHFLSDVLWAGFATYLSALVLYPLLFRRQDDAAAEGSPPEGAANPLALAGAALAATAVLFVALSLFPVDEDPRFRSGSEVPPVLVLEMDRADLRIRVVDSGPDAVQVDATVRGFGLPTYRIDSWAVADGTRLTYRLKHRGFFTEMDSRVTLTLAGPRVERVEVRLGEGDIRVEPPAPSGSLPELDLHTGQGQVERP